jgi:hypothetical protein
MTDRWLYNMKDGTTAYYQQGEYLLSAKGNKCEYHIRGEYVYPMSGNSRQAVFFIQNGFIYSMTGGNAVYFYGS